VGPEDPIAPLVTVYYMAGLLHGGTAFVFVTVTTSCDPSEKFLFRHFPTAQTETRKPAAWVQR
jgi:hypothetical protein